MKNTIINILIGFLISAALVSFSFSIGYGFTLGKLVALGFK